MHNAKLRLTAEEKQALLDTLGQSIAEKRDEAVQARKNSGIEDIWMDAEEAYLGIDDSNRGDFAKAKWAKPTSREGAVTTDSRPRSDSKSTAFVRLTSRYVDAGTAKLGEILLPVNGKPFAFEPTPIPELIERMKDSTPIVDPMTGQPALRPARPEELPAGAAGGNPDPAAALVDAEAAGGQQMMVPVTVKDQAEEVMNRAKEAAKKAEKRIYDWMVECKYAHEMRKVIHDSARIGVGVLKAPFAEPRTKKSVRKGEAGVELQILTKICPSAKWVDPWNLFPDPSCGENIHDGDYILERDFLSQRRLRDLKKHKGYIASQIDKVIKQGPGKCNENGEAPHEQKGAKNRFEVWYYYGMLNREQLQLAGCPGLDKLPADKQEIYAIVTLVNDSVIRAIINPLESGAFPYHVMPWTRRAGHWAGVGVAEQVFMPQRMVNAATRAMLNNAGKSAGSIIVMDQGSIIPADGSNTLTPDKIFYKLPDDVIDDVRKVFQVFQVPNITPQMMDIINYAFRLAEESSNIPLITQGQTGPTTPDTLGATQLQNNNANTLLRTIGYAFDDHITEPVVQAFYEWLLLDPSVPDEEKGDFDINAHGSIALVEQAIQDQFIQQMGEMVMNPAFGVNPKKWFGKLMTAKRLDARDVQYTEDEQKRIDAMAAKNPPKDPRIAAAEIQAQSRIRAEELRATTQASIVKAEQNNDNQQFMMEMELKRELAMLEYANREKVSLDAVKAALAGKAMDSRTKKELVAAEIAFAASQDDKSRADAADSLERDEMSTPTTP
jgi:hypothetical protein